VQGVVDGIDLAAKRVEAAGRVVHLSFLPGKSGHFVVRQRRFGKENVDTRAAANLEPYPLR
jgi:hypothetical protein